MINSVDVSESLKLISSCHPDGSVRLWDPRRKRELIELMYRRKGECTNIFKQTIIYVTSLLASFES